MDYPSRGGLILVDFLLHRKCSGIYEAYFCYGFLASNGTLNSKANLVMKFFQEIVSPGHAVVDSVSSQISLP